MHVADGRCTWLTVYMHVARGRYTWVTVHIHEQAREQPKVKFLRYFY